MSIAFILLLASAATPLSPPPTPIKEVIEHVHTRSIADPYRWLEQLDDPAVMQWARAQHAYTKSMLQTETRTYKSEQNQQRPQEIAIDANRLRELSSGATLFLARMAGDPVDALYHRSVSGKVTRAFAPSPGRAGRVRTIAFFEPAPNERLVALAIGESGNENNALYVLDLQTRKLIDGPIPGVRFATISWWPDSRRFAYPRLREPQNTVLDTALYRGQQVYAHTIGTDLKDDAVIFGSAVSASAGVPDTDFPVVEICAEAGLAFARHSAGVAQEFGLYVAPLASLDRPTVPWRHVFGISAGYGVPRASGSATITYSAGQIYLLHLAGKRALHRLDLNDPQHPSMYFADADSVVLGQVHAADGLYVQVQKGMHQQLLHFAPGSSAPSRVRLPFKGQFDLVNGDLQINGVTLRDRQWTTRSRYWRISAGVSKELSLVTVPVDNMALTAQEVLIDSPDGARIPLSIVRPGPARTHALPFLLTGYAAYGITVRPTFNDNLLPIYQDGMGYAVCHARGGGELGEDWHRAAMKWTKNRSWEDFIACAQWLIRHGYTRPELLLAEGASAGGMMVGRAMTERPDLFAGVHLAFGSLNPMRAETHANGAPNITEFGSLNNADEARWLFDMDTYHHVQPGVAYPAVLLTHGWNDARAPFWMSAKTAARLQAASTSGKPVLMNIDFVGGHHIGAGSQSQVLAIRRSIHAFFRLALRDINKAELAMPAQ